MPPFVPYLIGLVTAPVLAKLAKPILRGTMKATIGIALQVRKTAAEAVEDLQDLAAEAGAEIIAADMAAANQNTTRSRARAAESMAGLMHSVTNQKKS